MAITSSLTIHASSGVNEQYGQVDKHSTIQQCPLFGGFILYRPSTTSPCSLPDCGRILLRMWRSVSSGHAKTDFQRFRIRPNGRAAQDAHPQTRGFSPRLAGAVFVRTMAD